MTRTLERDGIRIEIEDRQQSIPVTLCPDFSIRFDCHPGSFHGYFDDEFHAFEHDAGGPPDIIYAIAPFTVEHSEPARRFDDYVVGSDWLFGRFVHKILGRWQIAIVGLGGDQPQVVFWGTTLSRWFVQNRVVEPLIRHQLSRKGASLYHGAALARGSAGVFLPAVRHTGKTTTAFHLIEAGFDFIADDYTPISDSGDMYLYPRRVNLFDYHLRTNPSLRSRLTLGRRLELARKSLIRRLTLGFANFAVPLHLKEIFPEARLAPVASLQQVICLSSGFTDTSSVRTDLSVDEAVTLATANNRREGRDFWNLLLAAEYAGMAVSAEGWFERERTVLSAAFSGARLSEVVLPAQEHLDPKTVADLLVDLCQKEVGA